MNILFSLILVAILSFPFNDIFRINPVVSIVLIGSSLILIYLQKIKTRNSKLVITIVLSALLLVFFVFFRDNKITKFTDFELLTINKRQLYYSKEFGELYTNRISLFLSNVVKPISYKYSVNIGEKIDFDNYFGNQRLSLSFFPLFLYGLVKKLSVLKIQELFYVMLFVFFTGLVSSEGLGSIIYFPIICLLIQYSIVEIINKLLKLYSNEK